MIIPSVSLLSETWSRIRPTGKAIKHFNVTCIHKPNLFLEEEVGE